MKKEPSITINRLKEQPSLAPYVIKRKHLHQQEVISLAIKLAGLQPRPKGGKKP